MDLVEADPMAEIVVGGVSPDRALADHAFARRLHRRADTLVSIGPGPLVVAPDLVSGVPADAATRAGRALALQLLGVAMARADGLSTDRVVVGAYPAWLADEAAAGTRILAEVTIRQALFPGHPMRFDEPFADSTDLPSAATWPYLVGAALGHLRGDALVMRRPPEDARWTHADGRAAAQVAVDVAAATTVPAALDGLAGAHARTVVAAAISTIERLQEVGWRAVLGESPPSSATARRRTDRAIGGDAVAERTEMFDPLGVR